MRGCGPRLMRSLRFFLELPLSWNNTYFFRQPHPLPRMQQCSLALPDVFQSHYSARYIRLLVLRVIRPETGEDRRSSTWHKDVPTMSHGRSLLLTGSLNHPHPGIAGTNEKKYSSPLITPIRTRHRRSASHDSLTDIPGSPGISSRPKTRSCPRTLQPVFRRH
jgi:hypothetical protein